MRPNRTPQATARYPIAIAHDYLTQRGGAERVVLALHKAFPEAPIYTTLYDPEGTYPEFKDCTVITSPLNKISIFRRDHRLALPLLPYFSNKLRVDAEKVVVSTTGWAHGFDMPSRALVYCHSPARWIYLTDQYMGHRINKGIARAFSVNGIVKQQTATLTMLRTRLPFSSVYLMCTANALTSFSPPTR